MEEEDTQPSLAERVQQEDRARDAKWRQISLSEEEAKQKVVEEFREWFANELDNGPPEFYFSSGTYGVGAKLILRLNPDNEGNSAGVCTFTLNEPGGASPEPCCSLQVKGTWERAKGTLKFHLTFDVSTHELVFEDGSSESNMQKHLKVWMGENEVEATFITEPNQSMEFHILKMPVYFDRDTSKWLDGPWIFNAGAGLGLTKD